MPGNCWLGAPASVADIGGGFMALLSLLAVAGSGGATARAPAVGDYIGTSLAGGKLTQQEQLLLSTTSAAPPRTPS